MNVKLEDLKKFSTSMQEIASGSRRVVRATPGEREEHAALIDRFHGISAKALSNISTVREALIARGKTMDAARLPDEGAVNELVTTLRRAIAEGNGADAEAASKRMKVLLGRIDQSIASVNTAADAAVQEKEAARIRFLNAALNDYAGGMFANVVKSSSFIDSAKTLLEAKIRKGARPVPLLPPFEESSLKKPGKSHQGISLPPKEKSEEEEFQEQYCRVKSVPMKTISAINLGMAFDLEIGKGDFIKETVLDSPLPQVPTDLNLVSLIKEYAANYGEVRYFYKIDPELMKKTYEERNSPLGDTPNVDALKKHLLHSMITHLLFQRIDSGFFEFESDARDEIGEFRSLVLRWGSYDGGSWVPNSIPASTYPPESLDNLISEYQSLYEAANAEWKATVDDYRNRVRKAGNAKATEVQEAINDMLATPQSQDDQRILEMANQILFYLDHAEIVESGADDDQLAFFYTDAVILMNVSYVLRIHFPQNSVQQIDKNYVEAFLKDTNYNVRKVELKDKLQAYLNVAAEIEEKMGSEWYLSENFRCNQIYRTFFETVRRMAMDAVFEHGILDEARRNEIKRLERQKESTKKWHINRIRSYFLLYDQIATGMLYSEFTAEAVSLLKKSCHQKRVVTDAYLPLVIVPKRASAYGELPKTPYAIERLDSRREGNFQNASPTTGILKEYKIEISHKGFGLGNHLYSQTLFPGESVSLEMRSHHKYKETQTESSAENIFEETTSDTLTDFSRELSAKLEAERKNSKVSSKEFGVEAGGGLADFFQISANASGKWSSQADERRFSDNVENVMDKLSTRLSQKRQVTLEVKRETTAEEEVENELKTTRSYSNINKEKNLTINFFQITREYETNMALQDMLFFYSSGRYPLLKMFVTPKYKGAFSDRPVDKVRYHDFHVATQQLMPALYKNRVVEELPPELWDYFAEETLILVLATPYSIKIPLSQANAFLISSFKLEKAQEINAAVWRVIGGGQASPEGLAVAAFPFGKEEEPELWPENPATNGAWSHEAQIGGFPVCADLVQIEGDTTSKTLATLDLRYKATVKIPSRYVDSPDGVYSIPKIVWSKDYVINTNGLYGENMLGRCSALEEFAISHRNLDVKLKEIQVEKERILLQKARALTPPRRSDFEDEQGYDQAKERYLEMKRLEGQTRYDIAVPRGANLNLNVNSNEENPGLNVSVNEKPEGGTTP